MQPGDIDQIVWLWQQTMSADPVDQHRLVADFLLDPHFDPAFVLIASDGDRDVGFTFGMRARPDQPSDNLTTTGIVVAFGVLTSYRRRGIGSALLSELECFWRDAGVERIQVGPWIPTYLTPGVDEEAHPAAVPFLESIGYVAGARPVSMRALLTGYMPAAEVASTRAALQQSGVTIRSATQVDVLPLLQFAEHQFPYWSNYVRDALRASLITKGPSTVQVAYRGDTVIGFALTNAERFGPFGVDESCRGQGVGAVLLSDALMAMRARNMHLAYFLWTSDRTARLYNRHGFEIVRRFTMMTKNLGERIDD